MKIKFRIGPIGGTIRATSRPVNNRGGGQGCPDDPMSIWSLRWFGATGIPWTENPVDPSLRRGAGACALFASRMSSRGCPRCNAADQFPSLDATRSTRAVLPWLRFMPQPSGQRTAPSARKPLKSAQFSGISTRFWSKSRSYRKQTIKPFLPGSRIAQCGARFLRDFGVNFLPAEPDRDRPSVARGTIKS
jgi:hypothetical protein